MATLAERMNQIERQLVEQELARHGGNRTETARALGVARSVFFLKLQRWRDEPAGPEPSALCTCASVPELVECARQLHAEAHVLLRMSRRLESAASGLRRHPLDEALRGGSATQEDVPESPVRGFESHGVRSAGLSDL